MTGSSLLSIRVNAELKPGALPGEALLVMEVTENQAPRWNCGLDIHNQRAPSVGGEQAEVWLENQNLTGYSDPLMLRLGSRWTIHDPRSHLNQRQRH